MEAPKILVVDDEENARTMLKYFFTSKGYMVEAKESGEEALIAIKSALFDVALVDIMMPGMNGIEALEKIKTDPEIQNIPIVMLTNLSGENDMDLAKEKGAIDYWVKKDIKPKEMGKKINKILQPSSL